MSISLNDFRLFVVDYFRYLKEIADTIPQRARESIPYCLTETSFIIVARDKSNRYMFELISSKNINELIINGLKAKPKSSSEPGYLVLDSQEPIERILFPVTKNGDSVSMRIGGHSMWHGFTFSSPSFQNKYKEQGFHAQFSGGEVPFKVLPNSSLLGIYLTYGYELESKRQNRLFEWLKIYGDESLIPFEKVKIQEQAISDFSSAVLKLQPCETPSFSDFLGSLSVPVDQNVLLLGSYNASIDYDTIKSSLKKLGYKGFLLKDSPDLAVQTNIEKLFAAVIYSCFIIVVDTDPSGHIAELNILLQHPFRPVIVLRSEEKPATAFLEDSIQRNDYFRIEVIKDATPSSLQPSVKWAKGLVGDQITALNRINAWRENT